ncbi:uncharacterized protein F4807DRAFT_467511 [Annulohypoxylon truncatum]|uniref:uncharacterized protein n=1 Tax=Annulohypoxylon truncatum TaxID=327061 RepID=UPI002008D415|nr:uncharacterized protein F4807DRAFT_467511 [Annulohypoxylon truncatum]KAI1210043.1 hypothetical protein F4807DRAFT_467511 [Annulohypoxylon truncatum]
MSSDSAILIANPKPCTMKPSRLLGKAIRLMDGFVFESIDELCAAPDSILTPFVKDKIEGIEITPEEARDNLASRVKHAFLIFVQEEDVYRRLRGDKAFYHLMLANWNSDHSAAPFPPARMKELMNLWIAARRRYLVANEHTEACDATLDLTVAVDQAISIIDDIDSTLPTRRTLGLNPPNGLKKAACWPPKHFGPLDVAIMAETATRKALFGVGNKHLMDEEDVPLYPNDQDHPLTARKFLCWLSLAETKPTSKASLFLAPVAFITHEERQDWYKITGHKSRFYATVDEFIDYARDEFRKTGIESKNYVMCLLTPWFFEKSEIVADAEKKDRPIPKSWEKGCFRAGMMLRINRVREPNTSPEYQVVLFKPGLPHYHSVAEPPARRAKQDVWVDRLLDELSAMFSPQEGWIGGAVRTHTYPNSRNCGLDSVEVSSEVIETVMRDPSTFPSTSDEFDTRGYTPIERYSGSQ